MQYFHNTKRSDREQDIYVWNKQDLDTIKSKVESVVSIATDHDDNNIIKAYNLSAEGHGAIIRYINAGKEIRESDEVKKFVRLVKSIYSRKNPFEDNSEYEFPGVDFSQLCSGDKYPYIFISASSGTGKTQLPFSLDIPIIYLLHDSFIPNISAMHSIQEMCPQICSRYMRTSIIYLKSLSGVSILIFSNLSKILSLIFYLMIHHLSHMLLDLS